MFDFEGKELTFVFDNEKAANHFKVWLCESGEQSYWDWMDYREEEEKDLDITGISFNYHSDNPAVIHVKCGRNYK